MTNRAALFARYIQCVSSTAMVMMSSINPYIDASFDVIYTANGYAVVIWPVDCCLSSCVSKDWCGEFRPSVSQDLSRRRSFPRSVDASLIVVYSAGAGVVSKGNLRQRKDSSSTIDLHVNAVISFACIGC